MRSLAQNLALVLAAVLLTAGLFEVGLRVAGFGAIHDVYSKPSIFWQHDPLLGWSHTPGSSGAYVGPRPWPIEFSSEIHINSLGLRGPEIEELPEDGYRVLVMGDSMVAAFEVPYHETFIAYTQRQLERVLGIPVQVINAGVRGYGTDQSYLYYGERGRALSPDLVVFLHSANDVRNNMTLHRMRRPFGKAAFALEADGALRLQGAPVPEYPLCSAYSMDEAFVVARRDSFGTRALCAIEVNAADHSALFTVASFAVQRAPWLMRRLHDLTNVHTAAVDAGLRLFTAGVAHAQPEDGPALDLTRRIIEVFAQDVADGGADFLLLVTASQEQRLGRDWLDASDFAWRLLSAQIVQDLSPELTFRNDSHWNAYGHQLIGNTVTRLLAQRIGRNLERREDLSRSSSPAR